MLFRPTEQGPIARQRRPATVRRIAGQLLERPTRFQNRTDSFLTLQINLLVKQQRRGREVAPQFLFCWNWTEMATELLTGVGLAGQMKELLTGLNDVLLNLDETLAKR